MRGEQHQRDFQDNEKTIPTILTASQKLSTGVDARNIRNIVLHDSIADAVSDLGKPDHIGKVFAGFQKYLHRDAA